MSVRINPERVRAALEHVQKALRAAAGNDGVLTPAELESALTSLAPTERSAADAFVLALRSNPTRGSGNLTRGDIDEAMRLAKRRLADSAVPLGVPAAETQQAKRFGEALQRLAKRLDGEPTAVLPAIPHDQLKHLRGNELKAALRKLCGPHVQLEYGVARDVMYHVVDADGGMLRCVYTRRSAPVAGRMELEQQHQFNAEHTWPQSQGVRDLPARSDLHHLFPTDAMANGTRASLPFGEVKTVVWQQDEARMGYDAAGNMVFEPPPRHRGNVSRALFYVSTIYGLPLDDAEEQTLRRWHHMDPVDGAERKRNDAVAAHQENRNPFVDDPDLVDRIDNF